MNLTLSIFWMQSYKPLILYPYNPNIHTVDYITMAYVLSRGTGLISTKFLHDKVLNYKVLT
jgi:hypothetical protein